MNTGFEYNPLPNGGHLDYWGATMQGYYHHDTHTLDMWTWQPMDGRVMTFEKIDGACPYWFGSMAMWASYDTHPMGMTLYNTPQVSADGIVYWGEVMNPRGVVLPGEAIVTKNPVVGEVVEAHSRVYMGCNSEMLFPSYHWRYQTTERYAEWNGYHDVVRTDLIEYNHETIPTALDWVYTYFFARDIGMVNVIWGMMDPQTSMVDGWAIGLI